MNNHSNSNRNQSRRSKRDNVLLRQQEAASALHLQEPLHSENVAKMREVYDAAVHDRLMEEYARDFAERLIGRLEVA